jgi:hypothetical protein
MGATVTASHIVVIQSHRGDTLSHSLSGTGRPVVDTGHAPYAISHVFWATSLGLRVSAEGQERQKPSALGRRRGIESEGIVPRAQVGGGFRLFRPADPGTLWAGPPAGT